MKISNVFSVIILPSLVLTRCPPVGPVLPTPSNIESLDLSNLKTILDGLSSGHSASKWNASTTSISIEITSVNSSFFTYHYTAPIRNESGVSVVDSNTIFRVASVTKVFTVLAVLLEDAKMKMEDLISKFVPELNDPKWAEITVGMLTSQISGAPRDVNVFDLLFRSSKLTSLGFPTPKPSEIPNCGTGIEGQPTCGRAKFFDLLLQDDLSWKPGDKAAYSDIAYILLGYALENATGIPYTQFISEKITNPLGLQNTGFELPPLSKGIIPVGMQWFTNDFDYYKATAGLRSTSHDLTAFLRAILNFTLLPPARTRNWLKPQAFTSSSNAVGAPWEIYRPTFLTPTPRPIDHYTKQGDIPGYSAVFILVPEYDIGAAILVAGENSYTTSIELFDAVEGEIVPKLDELARKQALRKHGGRYISRNSTGNATMELVVDSGPGLKISKWSNLGKDMLVTFDNLLFGGNGTKLDARIYPIAERERWRVVFEKDGPEGKETVTSTACRTWETVDQVRYAGLPCDEVDFQVGEEGEIVGVSIPGLRSQLSKI